MLHDISRAMFDALWVRYVERRQSGPRPLSSIGQAQRDAYEAGVRDGLALCEES